MENAVICGFGVVGKATANVFGIEKHFDIDETKSNITLKEAASCDFVFIALPTPVDVGNGFNTGSITNIINEVEKYGSNCIYIIRSTVNPTFALSCMEKLGMDRIISNPEFLSEDTADKDSSYPPFILLGGKSSIYLQKVKALYEGRSRRAPIILTDNTSAELAKLALNGFFATKVIYANQIYDYARKIGANYQTIRQVLENHPYGFKNHAQIWFKGKRGVNGKCLPKDSQALDYYSGGELIKKVVQLNENYINLKEDENL